MIPGQTDIENAQLALTRIMTWDFVRVVIAHGDLIEYDARETVLRAWEKPLRWARTSTLPAVGRPKP